MTWSAFAFLMTGVVLNAGAQLLVLPFHDADFLIADVRIEISLHSLFQCLAINVHQDIVTAGFHAGEGSR